MNYQTDYDGALKAHGCLFMCLARIVEMTCACEFSHEHLERFYFEMNRQGILSDEHDRQKEGAFVWNHKDVLDAGRLELGARAWILYSGCQWVGEGNSWGDRGGDYLILQIRTTNGGHFRLIDYDPWKPGTRLVDVRSIRYYRVA